MNKFCANLTKNCLRNIYRNEINRISVRNVRAFVFKGVSEPKYLDYLKPQIPYYPLLNIQIKGYDFVVLESYAKYLHNLCNKLGVNAVKFWCSPHSAFKYESLKPESEVTETQFSLNVYERNIQIENLSAKMAPILLEILTNSLPAGVRLSLHEHDYSAHEVSRYIPDLQLASFRAELEELKGSQIFDIEDEPKKKK